MPGEDPVGTGERHCWLPTADGFARYDRGPHEYRLLDQAMRMVGDPGYIEEVQITRWYCVWCLHVEARES